MLTRNFEIWKKVFPMSNQKSALVTTPDMTSIENVVVNKINAIQSSSYQACGLGVTANSYYNNFSTYCLTDLWVGKSRTDETIDDITIDAFSNTERGGTTSIVRSISGDKITLSFTREFTNASGSPITINELGFFKSLSATKKSDSANYNGIFLFDRRVLPEAITLADGEKHSFTYVIEL